MDPRHAAHPPGFDPRDVEIVVTVLHRLGTCPVQGLLEQPELYGWTPLRMEQAVVGAWSGGRVFINPDDDLVAL